MKHPWEPWGFQRPQSEIPTSLTLSLPGHGSLPFPCTGGELGGTQPAPPRGLGVAWGPLGHGSGVPWVPPA